ncbi:hypothetical protein IW140_001327 [Coemansia sp. RSA 1813]|nr:hypothetical protein EV178_000971 [Coemansia sp. RSA 1646]KAJ1769128.1 hypothetical protein LPJ74_004299 [Coemansia sp. RSA 1843]KAJ2091919.1 hypothetical protein IW138_001608 [Coemansia sp. RSA 986]KAJ2212456.1 hypothetical protein EV179_004638 [Coemansia sp. RSA 487]KAJ2571686.1 hypothetical protein IW140_001327 [Coemansia sp. RSA 1813]
MPGTRVEIHYCTGCRWLLRAGWTAQELLTTFGDMLGEVALIPKTGGVFTVYVDGEMVFDREAEERFPEMKELKQLIRNRISPDMKLGHSDSAVKSQQQQKTKERQDEPTGSKDEASAGDSCPNY